MRLNLNGKMNKSVNKRQILFYAVLIICVVFLSTILCGLSRNNIDMKIPSLTYNKNCYYWNISENDVEQWSRDIWISVQDYRVPMFPGQKENTELRPSFFRNNIKEVLRYPTNRQADNLVMASSEMKPAQSCASVSNNIPVIVTAGSSKFIPRFKNLFNSIHNRLLPHYNNLKIIFYDLEMSDIAIKDLKNMCPKCEIRKFPFHMFPDYCKKDLKNYIWKPLIIHKVLEEFDFVMWVDSSVEFRGGKSVFDDIFRRAQSTGIQIVSKSSIPKDLGSLVNMTKSETFRLLDENKEDFRMFPEVEANRLIFKRTPFIMNTIIRPWVGCALTENCMGDKHTRIAISCEKWIGPIPVQFILENIFGYDVCHRFDQSVLSIILTRIYGKYRRLVHTRYINEWVVNKISL